MNQFNNDRGFSICACQHTFEAGAIGTENMGSPFFLEFNKTHNYGKCDLEIQI
jgi:hypothetical protein